MILVFFFYFLFSYMSFKKGWVITALLTSSGRNNAKKVKSHCFNVNEETLWAGPCLPVSLPYFLGN